MSEHLRAARIIDSKESPRNSSSPATPAVAHPAIQSGGQALDRRMQNQMSARFGHTFSQVRVHADSRAEESAQALGANAYTVGEDIVFGPGKYQPGSRETERLLAHELTHVVQQRRWGAGDANRMSQRGDSSEREADSLADAVLAGRAVQVIAAPGAAIARDEKAGMDAVVEEGNGKNRAIGAIANDPFALMMNLGQEGMHHSVQTEAKQIEASREKEAEFQKQMDKGDFMENHADSMPAEGPLRDAEISLEGAENRMAFEKSGGAMMPEIAAEDAARMAGPLETAEGVNKALAPVAGISAGWDLYHDVKDGSFGKAGVDSANLAAGGIGTADLFGLLEGAKVLPGVGEVLGTFGASFGVGTELYNKTEVGADARDSMGDIDSFLGGKPGHSKLVAMDDRRKELWHEGGFGNDLKSIGYGFGEAGVATLGAGMGLGKAAYHQMKQDDKDAFGMIDSGLNAIGLPTSAEMDDRRQELWDKGGAANDAKAIGYGLGEAGVATAGAIAGGAKTTYRAVKGGLNWAEGQGEALVGGIKDAGSWLWDHTLGDSGPSDEEMAASQKQADAVMSENMDNMMNAEEDEELNGPSVSVAHDDAPPPPRSR